MVGVCAGGSPQLFKQIPADGQGTFLLETRQGLSVHTVVSAYSGPDHLLSTPAPLREKPPSHLLEPVSSPDRSFLLTRRTYLGSWIGVKHALGHSHTVPGTGRGVLQGDATFL